MYQQDFEKIKERDIQVDQMRLQTMQIEEARGRNRKLYIRGQWAGIQGGACCLEKDHSISFDTYYNAFSAGKWKKYTAVETVSFCVCAEGKLEAALYHAYQKDGSIEIKRLYRETISADAPEKICLTKIRLPDEGVLYPVFSCMGTGAKICSWSWETEKEPERSVRMALNLCTFHREQEVRHNLSLIKEKGIHDPDSSLYRNLEIYLTDNGRTLQEYREDPLVHYCENKNIGGTGGFTRGMTEILRQADAKNITHLVFMDDDANLVISTLEIMQRFLEYLKPEYAGHTICGALMRRELPWIQAEAGAQWHGGTISSVHGNYDMRNFENVIKNETEATIDYSGWWLSCMAVETARKSGLPLPLFLHRDDVEYGLRQKGKFITMNGISIRHETYDTKLSQATEYYDIRNMAIVESIHDSAFSKKQLKKMIIKWMAGNFFRYRYQYIQINVQGVKDFLKGAGWLMDQDAGTLHGRISAMCYLAEPGEKLPDTAYYESLIRSGQEKGQKRKLLAACILPGRGGCGTLVPWQSVYDYAKYAKVKITEFSGRCVTLERRRGELLRFFGAVRSCAKGIDQDFEIAKKSYQQAYGKLISYDTWSRQWNGAGENMQIQTTED